MKAFVRNAILCLQGIWLVSLFPPILYGQALAYSKANVSLQQGNPAIRLRDILLDMQEKHNINIVFDDNLLQGLIADPGKVKHSGKVAGILESILGETGLHAIEIRKNTYLIVPKKGPEPRRAPQPEPIAPPAGIKKRPCHSRSRFPCSSCRNLCAIPCAVAFPMKREKRSRA